MGYLNPVEIRGAERFAPTRPRPASTACCWSTCRRKKLGELRAAFDAHGLALILLAAPTTPRRAPARACATRAQGYLYYVSFAGVTGADRLDAGAAGERLRAIRARSARAGASRASASRTPPRPPRWRAHADGVVVGSALVAACAGAADAGRRRGGAALSCARCARRSTAPGAPALDCTPARNGVRNWRASRRACPVERPARGVVR